MLVRALVATGFVLDNVHRKPSHLLVECHRHDEFGVRVGYLFALGETPLEDTTVATIANFATSRRSHAVILGEARSDRLPVLPWPAFVTRCGGPIRSWLPLEPEFAERLDSLGHNRPTPGDDGRPDDLFEEYVQVGLEFLLADRVIRYGQDRRGERRPDGLAFAPDDTIFVYDAKAYEHGYPVNVDTVRQVADYIRDFQGRYRDYLPRVHAALLVSGHFAVGQQALERQARRLYAECGVRFCYMKAADLGAATQLLARHPALRRALDWKEIFSELEVTAAVIQRALDAARRDGVVRS